MSANRRLLSGLFGMWSSMKITLCYAKCCKWKTSSFVLIKSNMLCTMFRKQLSTHLPPLPGLVISQVVHIDLIWLTKQNIIRDPGKYPRMIETIPNWSSSPETFCEIIIKLPSMCKNWPLGIRTLFLKMVIFSWTPCIIQWKEMKNNISDVLGSKIDYDFFSSMKVLD